MQDAPVAQNHAPQLGGRYCVAVSWRDGKVDCSLCDIVRKRDMSETCVCVCMFKNTKQKTFFIWSNVQGAENKHGATMVD